MITSPSLILAPMEISKGDLLVEAVVLGLGDALAEEAVRRNISGAQRSQTEQQLRALLYGVQLWQAWSNDLPLAVLRKPVVEWIYGDVGHGARTMPGYHAQLCDLHRLWVTAPAVIQVPLFCAEPEQGDPYQTWRYLYTSPWRLTDKIDLYERDTFRASK